MLWEFHNNAQTDFTSVHSNLFSPQSGSTIAKVTQNGHNSSPVFGLMKQKKFQRGDCERLLRKMVIDGILQEDLHIGVHDQAISYATTGPKASDVLNGRMQVSLYRSIH